MYADTSHRLFIALFVLSFLMHALLLFFDLISLTFEKKEPAPIRIVFLPEIAKEEPPVPPPEEPEAIAERNQRASSPDYKEDLIPLEPIPETPQLTPWQPESKAPTPAWEYPLPNESQSPPFNPPPPPATSPKQRKPDGAKEIDSAEKNTPPVLASSNALKRAPLPISMPKPNLVAREKREKKRLHLEKVKHQSRSRMSMVSDIPKPPKKKIAKNQAPKLPLKLTPSLRDLTHWDKQSRVNERMMRRRRGEAVVPLDTKESRYVSYFRRMQKRIQFYWRYPASAKRKNITGALSLQFAINSRGKLVHLKLVRSSGHAMLDEAAINAVRQAEPFSPFPVTWWEKKIIVPVRFQYFIK
ncbi:energy transducer TonB [Magnetococcales bacterium HHB-1]